MDFPCWTPLLNWGLFKIFSIEVLFFVRLSFIKTNDLIKWKKYQLSYNRKYYQTNRLHIKSILRKNAYEYLNPWLNKIFTRYLVGIFPTQPLL